MSTQVGGGWDTAVETKEQTSGTPGGGPAPQGGKSIFVDQSESVVATIGSNYLQNFLSGGSVEKGVGVLTQKRFYFKGQNFSGEGKTMKNTTEEGVVSIEDITFTRFSYTRHIGALILAILLTAIAAVLVVAIEDTGFAYAMIALVPAIFFYVLYFIGRKTVFQVSFPGGSFGFDIFYYPISDIRDFQRQLHLMKDYIKEGTAV